MFSGRSLSLLDIVDRSFVSECFCVVVASIKNDFVAQLHKFMANLTDTRWKMDGKTVLYIPHEGTVVPVSPTTAKNKELIHRLESMASFHSNLAPMFIQSMK